MHPFRRKTPLFNSEAVAAMKGRKNNNLSIFVVVFSICLFGLFIYNEDVKSIAEFPFSSRPKSQETVQEVESKHVDSVVVQRDTEKEEDEDSTKKGTVRVTVSKNSRAQLEKKSQDDGDEDSDETQQQRVDLKTVVAVAAEEEEEEKEEKIELKEGEEEEEEEEEVIELPPEDCDLYTGEWVLDNLTHPLYKEDECEFLTSQVTCMKNGRRDSMYQNWKWQPRDCSLPK